MSFENTLWQSREWESFQNSLGNRATRLDDILVIERGVALGKSYLEVPRPTRIPAGFWAKLEMKARETGALFSRVYPGNSQKIAASKEALFRGIPETFPPHTLVLDLRKSEQELLQEMKPKGRYNISLAERKGIEVVPSKDVTAFYNLLRETTARDKFSGHPLEVYQQMLDSFGTNGFLLLANYQKKVIAAGIFLCHDGVCTYYYGASANEYRNLMAPYLLQWTAIQEAERRGCDWYDFLGIAPENADASHRLFGVSQFKEKFGGIRIKYPPAFEIVQRRGWYRVLKTAKKLRSLF